MSSTSQQFVNEVLRLTNEFRAENGLSPLKANSELDQTAQKYSQTMATGDFFSHTGKDNSTPWSRAEKEGYKARTMGENIAVGQRSPQQVVQGWIDSPGHRRNMLNPNFTELGVGYFNLENDTGKVNYNTYWTQLFGSGDLLVSAAPTPVKSPTPPPEQQPTAPVETPTDNSGSPRGGQDSLAPVAELSFEEGSGLNANDTSTAGARNNARLASGTGWTAGKKGGAIALNGQDRGVTFDNSNDINRGQQAQRTVSLWFKVDDASQDKKQVIYEEGGSARGLNAYIDDDRLFVGGWNTPETKWNGSWISTDKVSSGQWHHAAIVLDGQKTITDNALTAYLDGQKIGQAAGSQLWGHNRASLGSVTDSTRFADGISDRSGTGFTGAIDEVKIFNDALTASQVQGLAAV